MMVIKFHHYILIITAIESKFKIDIIGNVLSKKNQLGFLLNMNMMRYL